MIAAVLFFSTTIIIGHSQAYAQSSAKLAFMGDSFSTTPNTTGSSNGSPVNTTGSSNGTPVNTTGSSNSSGGTTFTLTNPLSGINSIGGLVQNFVQIFSYIVILFAVLMFIYTGFQYITAQGNSTKIKDLHARLLYIVIGVAVVIGARVIIDVVINTLSATGTVNQQVIQQAKNANSGN